MPQRAPGDLTEDPGSFFFDVGKCFCFAGGMCVCVFFWGMCFFNCLEGTGIEGTPIWREVFGCKIGCGEQFVADEKTDPRQHSLNDYHPAGWGIQNFQWKFRMVAIPIVANFLGSWD